MTDRIDEKMEIKKEHEALVRAIIKGENASFSQDIAIEVRDGIGSYGTGWLPTFGLSVKGDIKVTAPTDGTWKVTVYDDVQKKDVYKVDGILPNEPYPFTFGTSFWGISATIRAEWSEHAGTTVKVHVNVGI